jgi:glucose/arabinose dehydrogenase
MKPFATFRAVMLLLLLAGALVLPAAPAAGQAEEVDDDVVYEVLAEGTNEPTQVEVASDGRIIWTERDGTINVLTPEGLRIVAAEVRPAANMCETCEPEPDYLSHPPNRLGVGGLEEGGVHGLLLHRNFAENNKIFLYRSVAGTRKEVARGVFWGEFRLSTFVLDPETNLLDTSSEKVILKVPAEWDYCCHYGGDLDYLPDGTITLTTGDDVDAASSGGYGPRDKSAPWLNGELTSANPADLRGKILRLNEDGSVPDGSEPGVRANPFIGMEGYNPYIKDTQKNVYVGKRAGKPGDGWIEFDPYVYAMGFKQPWRAVVHPKSGTIYVSDVGPDASADDPKRGPRGFEEINRVPFGGGTHYGWPRCMGPNWAYVDVDWKTMKTHGKLDCSARAPIARPIGSKQPKVQGMTGATMYYPSGMCDGSENQGTTYDCDRWPIVGSGGKTSEPTVFYSSDVAGPLALPKRYRDRMFMFEWSRSYLLTIPADPRTGELDLRNKGMDLVQPPLYSVNPNTEQPQTSVSVQQAKLMAPIDGAIGPDGALYFLEYGAFFYAGEDGRLSRIRGADATLDGDANYGLPVDGGASMSDPGPRSPGTLLPYLAAVAFVTTAGIIMLGRRRVVPA